MSVRNSLVSTASESECSAEMPFCSQLRCAMEKRAVCERVGEHYSSAACW